MAADRDIADFVYQVRVPILLAMGLSIVVITTARFMPGNQLLSVAVFVLRVMLVALAGYVIVSKGSAGLWAAAFAGAMVFFAEHVVVLGLFFILTDQLTAAGGVVMSYLMFFWVAMLIGVVGGVIAMRWRRHAKAAI